ncbi:MAG TPA: dipeptidase [Deltaproteobacteria bacterium]|nr:dipeptidase [Deltaproteobacteria bacterium]
MRVDTQMPVIDGHNDTLLNLYLVERGGGRSFFHRSDIGHIDLPRARQGGLAAGFFSLFVPQQANNIQGGFDITRSGKNIKVAPPVDFHYARDMTHALMASLFRLVSISGGQMKIVHNTDELTACMDTGTLAVIMHLEGAEAIDPRLEALEVFYQAGLRSLGITWSRPNIFGYGSPFIFPHSPDTGEGLTDYGKRLVKACNEMNIMIDCAHLNEKGFWDVVSLSESPLVVTHSGAHRLCQSSRNLTDSQIDAIGASGGIIGVTFFVRDLRPDGRIDENTSLKQIAEHISYIAGRIGIDHVGFGSDFDGARIPKDLGDVTGLPRLVAELQNQGFDREALEKITHKNWIRVLRNTWQN